MLGSPTDAIRPATTPPIATPPFIESRWSAYAGALRAAGVSPASSADWEGQNDPLPMPHSV